MQQCGVFHGCDARTMAHCVLKNLKEEDTEIKEFFLPKDGPGFCVGCNNCFMKGEETCPEAAKVQPIVKAMDWADVIMLDTPNYCMEMSGAMKSLLDHFGYRWVTHRPHESMFHKVGVTLASSAGAPPNGVVKSLAKQLKCKFMRAMAIVRNKYINCKIMSDGRLKDREMVNSTFRRLLCIEQRFKIYPMNILRRYEL